MAKQKFSKAQATRILKSINAIIKDSGVTGVSLHLEQAGGLAIVKVSSHLQGEREETAIDVTALLPLQIAEKVFHELRYDIAQNEKRALEKRLNLVNRATLPKATVKE